MSVTRDNEIDKSGVDAKADKPSKPEKQVTVLVDGESVLTPKDTTPGKVLIAARLDPSQRRLVKVKGKHQTPYPIPDVALTVHDGEQFITVSTGGTPVS